MSGCINNGAEVSDSLSVWNASSHFLFDSKGMSFLSSLFRGLATAAKFGTKDSNYTGLETTSQFSGYGVC